jgi:hypothetical protein
MTFSLVIGKLEEMRRKQRKQMLAVALMRGFHPHLRMAAHSKKASNLLRQRTRQVSHSPRCWLRWKQTTRQMVATTRSRACVPARYPAPALHLHHHQLRGR